MNSNQNNTKISEEHRDALADLLCAFRSAAPVGLRVQQGKDWHARWVGGDQARRLTDFFKTTPDAVQRFKQDDLPADLQDCDIVEQFIGFVDVEATKNWTRDYDTVVADQIIEGFVVATQTYVLDQRRRVSL